jgi:hypothetical protein
MNELLVVTPNGYKSSKLYSIVPTDGSGDFTVVRATTATRINSSGVIESVSANVPRLDYTDEDCPSILIEPQRTNLVFPSATATTQNVTVTNVAHVLSFYGTGSVTLSGTGSGTLNGTGANDRVQLAFTPTAGTLTLTVTGSVTSWQLEEGVGASSYIPTVGSSATRNADEIYKTGISSLIPQSEGSIFIDCKVVSFNGHTNVNILNSEKNTSCAFSCTLYDNGDLVVGIYNGGVGDVVMVGSLGSYTLNQRLKILINYKTGDSELYVNGALRDSDSTAFTFSSTWDDIFINDSTTYFSFQGLNTYNQVVLLPYISDSAQSIELTTI